MEYVDKDQKVSLCVDCARHPSLRRIISAQQVEGLCGLCGRHDARVRDPENTEPLVMLIRALIRYYWDEHEYNPHWGGESVTALFSDPENPVVEPAKTTEFMDDFNELIEWPPYPDPDKGIAIYAGFVDGDRLVDFAISKTSPMQFVELNRRLLKENFFAVEPAVEELIVPFLADIEFSLPPSEVWFRARLGEKEVYRQPDGWKSVVRRQPWQHAEIAAPPPPKAGIGRLNRAGVSMLYLASDEYTAISEIRPHPGHYVSVGAFRSSETLKLADFNPDIERFSSSEARLHQYSIIQAFDRLMSMPVTPDEKTPYLLTQLLAEILLRRGLDGVRYRSSVSEGSNICIFRPEKFEFFDEHSKVMRVDGVSYGISAAASVLTPRPEDLLFKGRL